MTFINKDWNITVCKKNSRQLQSDIKLKQTLRTTKIIDIHLISHGIKFMFLVVTSKWHVPKWHLMRKMRGKVSLVLLLLSEIFISSGNETNYCGQKILHGTNGTIRTNPTLFDKNISCQWTIHPPPSRITTITILQTGLDKCLPKYSCCLSVMNAASNRNYIKLCNETPEKPVTLSLRGNETLILLEASQKTDARIDFSTRENSECRYSEFQCYDKTGCYNSSDNCSGDFICEDHSDKVNCGKCPINFTFCNMKYKRCFDPISQRCDGIRHCAKGEDELGCSKLCPDSIKCPKDNKCIRQDQICDAVTNCNDDFDEKGCIKSSPSMYFPIVFVITALCSMSFLCIVFQWISTRRRSRRFVNNPPDFPLAPFEGPGEQAQQSSSSEIFTDSEFRQGGGIYESYLQTIKKTKPLKSVVSNTNRQKSYMDLDGDNELIVLASLNVPVDMCVGLTVSNEKANMEAFKNGGLSSVSKLNLTVSQPGSGESSQSTEIRCVEENPRKSSSRCNSGQTFIVSNSSEWTDIEEASQSSSRIIFVRSAKNT